MKRRNRGRWLLFLLLAGVLCAAGASRLNNIGTGPRQRTSGQVHGRPGQARASMVGKVAQTSPLRSAARVSGKQKPQT